MATPAEKLQQDRERLFDATLPTPDDFWLHRMVRDVEDAWKRRELREYQYHDLLGVLRGLLKDHSGAIRHGRVANQIAYDDATVAQHLAVSYLAADEPRDAIDCLAPFRDVPDVAVRCTLAAAYFLDGDPSTARRVFREASDGADLGNAEHMVRLAGAAMVVGLYSEALRLFARALAVRGVGRIDDAESDPRTFVMNCVANGAAVPDWVSDVTSRFDPVPRPAPDAPVSGDDDDAMRVFTDFSASRRRATRPRD